MRLLNYIKEQEDQEDDRLDRQIERLQDRITRERESIQNIDPEDDVRIKQVNADIADLEVQLARLKERLE